MSEKPVTLKDLAKASGYSLTSVYRAINDKEGIGEDVRSEIIEIAERIGYKVNYLASSLKKTPVRIGVVMPEPTTYGHYYHYILKGCQDMLRDMAAFNCQLVPCFSDLEIDSERKQLEALNQLYKEEAENIQGLLIVPVRNTSAIQTSLERFIARGTAVLLIDNEFEDLDRLCCISPQDFITGKMAAEFLCGTQPPPGTILIATGDKESLSHAYNLRGFSEFIRENKLPYMILEVGDGSSVEAFTEDVRAILAKRKDIVALYTVRARNTIPLCKAAVEARLAGKLKIVGSDLNPDSAKALKEGILTGIIYKNPYQKGFIGMKTLFDHLVKGEKPEERVKKVPIFVILRSNLEFFRDIYEEKHL